MKSVFCSLVCCFLLGGTFLCADDIDVLRSRLQDEYVNTTPYSSAGSYLSSQQSDGSWSDIDYGDTSSSSWKPGKHLTRLTYLSAAYAHPDSGYTNTAAVKDAVSKGLDYWFSRNPRSNNWWYNEISGPGKMAKVLIIMEPHLTSTQIQKGIAYSDDGIDKDYTGQNLIWVKSIKVALMVLDATHDLAELNEAFGAMGSIIAVSDEEGIRQDHAFHQHGRQLYNGGYGEVFLEDMSSWMPLSQGLSFAFSQEQIDLFSSLILDGSQWMIRRAYWDHATQGREISRPGGVEISSDLDQVLSNMISMGTSRQEEFQTFLDHTRGNNDLSLVGNKHFWLSDYQAHRRPGYYASVKMCSPRALSHEAGNGENLQGYYLSQGAMMIMRDGLEYKDIYPVWDWGRIPGVTSPHKDPAPKPPNWRFPGTATFAGGTSDGTYGTAGFDFSWDGAWGKKAWFFFDDEVVALGAGLGGDAAEPIYSSVNQSLKRGSINVSYDSGSGSSLGIGEHTLDSPRWVHHDQVGYVFPNPSVVQLKNADQSGSWQEINSNKSSSMITKSVFSLWFDHGVGPSDQSYAYILVPGASLSEVQSYANSLPVRILSNTTQQQAVRNDALGIAGIVFYTSGTVTLRPGLSLEADAPCIVLVNEAGSETKVTVAHPENAEITVTITLSGDLNEVLVYNLPTGRFAGSSMTLSATGAPVNDPPASPEDFRFKTQ